MNEAINRLIPDFTAFSVEEIRTPAPDWETDQRARLLWWGFDAGLAPVHALDQAREMWAFVRGPEVSIAAAFAEANADVVGIALSDGHVWRRVDHDGATLHVDYATFRDHPIFSRIREAQLDDSEVVGIPRFWLRSERRGDERIWWISPRPREGFRLHPAFLNSEGGAAGFIWISKHLAGRWKTDEGFVMMERRPPLTDLTIEEARRLCGDLGEGWRLWSAYDLAAVQLLALIDKGAPIGGMVGVFEQEGASLTGVLPSVWRGIQDLWGNVWQFVDGLRINAWGVIEVWDDQKPGAERWTDTGVPYGPGPHDGLPAAFHDETGAGFDLSAIFVPSRVVSGSAPSATQDHVWGFGGDRGGVALSGGSWISRHDAGLFSLSFGVHAEKANPSIGFRPVFAG